MDKKLKLTKLTKLTVANLQQAKGGDKCYICIYPYDNYANNHDSSPVSVIVCKLP